MASTNRSVPRVPTVDAAPMVTSFLEMEETLLPLPACM